MKQLLHNISLVVLFIVFAQINVNLYAQPGPIVNSGPVTPAAASTPGKAPELIFINPVLVSGKDKQEGATYRYSSVTAGIDAEIKMKKFSSKSIVMNSFDNTALGWAKAFQPEFGMPGTVQPWQNWYIDFEMNFYKSGTNQKVKLQSVDMTALDVDGDGVSISEYVNMYNASSVSYSSVSYLLGSKYTVGGVGQTFTCPDDGIASTLMTCPVCQGSGSVFGWQCDKCDGSGLLYSACQDAYHVNTMVDGPIENFNNIDTGATQVMSTYNYKNVDKISFRYGAKSSSKAVSGSGIRLNSLWFRQFSLAPAGTLPVKLSGFTASYDQTNVSLKWTGYEEKFSHYILQKSTDGQNFSDMALIFTDNGSKVSTNYSYTDKKPSSSTGSVFYRLKMVDLTEEFTYSDIRLVHLGAALDTKTLSVYPNPVSGTLRVTLPAEWQNKDVMFEVYSNTGVLVSNKRVGSASQTENLELTRLPRGNYIVKASNNGTSITQVVLKQ